MQTSSYLGIILELTRECFMREIQQALDELQRYAGFWRRTAATVIDQILIIIALVPIAYLLFDGDFSMASTPEHWLQSLNTNVVEMLLSAAVILAFWFRFGATPGKMLLNCEIVDAETLKPASKQQLCIRYIGYFVSTLPLLLGFFWVAWDSKKQGFHDKIAGTVVTHKEI